MATKNSSIIKQGDDLIDWAIVSKACRKKENGYKSPGLFRTFSSHSIPDVASSVAGPSHLPNHSLLTLQNVWG